MRIVECEAREFTEHRLLALKLGFRQLAAVSTRTDDREADVHRRFGSRARTRGATWTALWRGQYLGVARDWRAVEADAPCHSDQP